MRKIYTAIQTSLIYKKKVAMDWFKYTFFFNWSFVSHFKREMVFFFNVRGGGVTLRFFGSR